MQTTHPPSAVENALALSLARSHVEVSGWSRPPVGDAIVLAWNGRQTLTGVLQTVTGLQIDCWADLASPQLHGVWDALVLALHDITFDLWKKPRTGLDQVGRVLAWERSSASQLGDVMRLLRTATYLAEVGATEVGCPVCLGDPWYRPSCECCVGVGFLRLSPTRWTRMPLRVVDGGAK